MITLKTRKGYINIEKRNKKYSYTIIVIHFKIDEISMYVSILFLFIIISYCIIIVKIYNDLYFSFYIRHNIFLFVYLLVFYVILTERASRFIERLPF